MDTINLNDLRSAVQTVIEEYAAIPYARGEIEREVVCDRERDRYMLLSVGWDGQRRVHGCVIHVDIIDGRCWIQRDGTEEGVAVELERKGVPKDRIVLAFKRPATRALTEYAVG